MSATPIAMTEPVVPESESSAAFSALGCEALLLVTDLERLSAAHETVDHVIAEFDRSCSRFREDSELAALHRASGSALRVGSVLLDAVDAALRAAIITDGDVDPTVGEALIALGYDRDFEQLRTPNSQGRKISIARVPGWRSIAIDRDASTIRVPRGVRLDLGATAKALAVDRAARAAQERTGCGILLSIGGDIAIAGPAPSEGWRVRVTDDHRAGVDAPGQWISLRSGGLATSSTTTRRWQMDSSTVHHLVDPSTGRSAVAPWRTVSVTAATCLDANIASTAAIVRGQLAADWLRSLGLPSRLVANDGSVLHLAGWPVDGDDLPATHRVHEVPA